MLPHNHFLISTLVVVPAAIIFGPEKSAAEIGRWVLAGGVVSMAIDLDIIALVILKSKQEDRLKQFNDPLRVYRKFKLFMDTIAETGVLKTGLKTHLFFSVLVVLFFYLFIPAYFVPVLLGVLSHLASDIPNIKRALTFPLREGLK